MAATQLGRTKDSSAAVQSPQVVVAPVAAGEQQLQLLGVMQPGGQAAHRSPRQHPGSDPPTTSGSKGGAGAPPEMATDGEASSSLSKCIDFSAENRLRLTSFLITGSIRRSKEYSLWSFSYLQFALCLFAIVACVAAKPAVIAAPLAYSAYSSPYVAAAPYSAAYTAAYTAPVAAAYSAYPYASAYSAYSAYPYAAYYR
ncbi:hypothetical protein KR084_012566 [Drosophila pseudotakahashii]|nr:hypothetical protein KR084_012566 [Drosophila pseudotakahashii]